MKFNILYERGGGDTTQQSMLIDISAVGVSSLAGQMFKVP
jgi:hypothetical protein